MTTLQYATKEISNENVRQKSWQRLTLIIVLGYEAAGCLLGGSLLIAAPDGRYMDMPVSLMNGVFANFLVPGIILFGLGILNSLAFIAVLRKAKSDWFMSGLAMGGLFIWFVVEIIILQELHRLHYMWGFPVFVGCVAAIPLITARQPTVDVRKVLLGSGIYSSLWYVAANIFVPMMYKGYNMASYTVSELSALGAPTRILWVLLMMPYLLLFSAFGWGVWQSKSGNPRLGWAGGLIVAYSIINFYWPPMHQRQIIAAGGGTLTDTLHIVWSIATLLFMLLIMGFGAAGLKKWFRHYTVATWVIFIVCGVLTFMQAPGLQKGLPTPLIGVWERINIGAFMLWIVTFAVVLIRREKKDLTMHYVHVT